MITFLKEKISNGDIRYVAYESDKVIGLCDMRIDGMSAEVYSLTFDEDKPYCVEGLLRAAYNYAVTVNAYMGYCSCKNITDFLDRMNFEKKDGIYSNDIPSILMGSCCRDKH